MEYFIPLGDVVERLEAVAEKLNSDCEDFDDETARIQDKVADEDRIMTYRETVRISKLSEMLLDYENQLEIVVEAIRLLERYRGVKEQEE